MSYKLRFLRPNDLSYVDKTGHFGDVPQANLLAWYGKIKPKTTKARIYQSKEMHYNTNTTQQQPFYGPLSWTTRVSRYQKKHSPTHHPDHHSIFISFFHLPRSIAFSGIPR